MHGLGRTIRFYISFTLFFFSNFYFIYNVESNKIIYLVFDLLVYMHKKNSLRESLVRYRQLICLLNVIYFNFIDAIEIKNFFNFSVDKNYAPGAA